MHQVPCIKTQGGHMPVSPSNRRQWLAMGTALISLSCAASAASTTYPSKPLRILVHGLTPCLVFDAWYLMHQTPNMGLARGPVTLGCDGHPTIPREVQIGRASCRERV